MYCGTPRGAQRRGRALYSELSRATPSCAALARGYQHFTPTACSLYLAIVTHCAKLYIRLVK